jgi:quinolinate synthase
MAVPARTDEPAALFEAHARELDGRINARKRELNAVILGHNYQRGEIQDVSDYVGDSLGLSQEAAATPADVIVFCGVHFMAETAKILSPSKTRAHAGPPKAGCPMADFVTGESLRRMKAAAAGRRRRRLRQLDGRGEGGVGHLLHQLERRAGVESIDRDRPILFVPDRNLAKYVAERTGRRCAAASSSPETAAATPARSSRGTATATCTTTSCWTSWTRRRRLHPNAKVVIHPEARRDLLERADFVVSTSAMAKLAEPVRRADHRHGARPDRPAAPSIRTRRSCRSRARRSAAT